MQGKTLQDEFHRTFDKHLILSSLIFTHMTLALLIALRDFTWSFSGVPQKTTSVLHSVFLLILCHLLLFPGSQLKECSTKSKRCDDSQSMPEIFHCHVQGKFPHPRNNTVFLKCPDPGFKACLCRCKYEQMCFDIKTSVCKFELLGDLIDCSRPLVVSFQEAVTQIHPPVIRPNFLENSERAAVVIVEKPVKNTSETTLKSKEKTLLSSAKTAKADTYSNVKQRALSKMGETRYNEVLHEHSLVHSNPSLRTHSSHLQKTTISARQIAKPLKLIVRDHSSFPTWAVALVVLCIVILLVLIVLLMYWCVLKERQVFVHVKLTQGGTVDLWIKTPPLSRSALSAGKPEKTIKSEKRNQESQSAQIKAINI